MTDSCTSGAGERWREPNICFGWKADVSFGRGRRVKSRRSSWHHLPDLIRLGRCRLAENRREFGKARRLLEAAPARDSAYTQLMRLYRLKLMVVEGDPDRHAVADQLKQEQWLVRTEEERYYDGYRRMMCAGLAGELEEAEEAAEGLRRSPVRAFIKNTLPPPSPGGLQNAP